MNWVSVDALFSPTTDGHACGSSDLHPWAVGEFSFVCLCFLFCSCFVRFSSKMGKENAQKDAEPLPSEVKEMPPSYKVTGSN